MSEKTATQCESCRVQTKVRKINPPKGVAKRAEVTFLKRQSNIEPPRLWCRRISRTQKCERKIVEPTTKYMLNTRTDMHIKIEQLVGKHIR